MNHISLIEQLTESEMLQQAIKMSTIDFFENQKRKLHN